MAANKLFAAMGRSYTYTGIPRFSRPRADKLGPPRLSL